MSHAAREAIKGAAAESRAARRWARHQGATDRLLAEIAIAALRAAREEYVALGRAARLAAQWTRAEEKGANDEN